MMPKGKKTFAAFAILVLSTLAAGTFLSTSVRGAPQAPPSAPVTVVNTDANPVPVVGSVEVSNLPQPGTPFLESIVNLNGNEDGFQDCDDVFLAAAGTAVILKTISGIFNVPPGTFGSMKAVATIPGGQRQNIPMLAPRTAPASRGGGLYDSYAGSLDMGGLPVVRLEFCISGVGSAGELAAIGFTVPLP